MLKLFTDLWLTLYNLFFSFYTLKRAQQCTHTNRHHHHHHQCLASVFPCTHGSDVSPKIFLLHNCLSWASSTLKPKSFMSLFTHCNHVFLPLPLHTLSINSYITLWSVKAASHVS